MREIAPPRAYPISRTKVFLDGIAYGKRYEAPLSNSRQKATTAQMIQARRQLDAVHARQLARRKWSWKRLRRGSPYFFRRIFIYLRRFARRLGRSLPAFTATPKRAFYASLVAGVSFGMVSMGVAENFISSHNAAAQSNTAVVAQEGALASNSALKEELSQDANKYDPNDDLFLQYFSEASKDDYANQIENLVKGYPIEDMVPYIVQQDRIVAAFLIGIAKKESNWGKRVPVLAGQDCFNYWGYRGIRRLMGTGGHTCFNSREDAVNTVAKRLNTLVNSEKLDTPEKIVIWKCGYSCAGQNKESVQKWISDVDLYFSQLNGEEDDPAPPGDTSG